LAWSIEFLTHLVNQGLDDGKFVHKRMKDE
jgi:hypothetical protein